MARYQPRVLNFDANDVWAAACAAQRINGDYIKQNQFQDKNVEPNRSIMQRLLNDTTSITDIDREQGKTVRKYYQGLTFKVLQGKKLNEFDNSAMVIANRDNIANMYDVAVIASLPSCYERNKKRDDSNRRLDFASGGFIGSAGDKVELNVEVIRCNFSQQWNTFFVSGITPEDQAVFFSYREKIESGKNIKVSGTVKAHREKATQLNRVKVI